MPEIQISGSSDGTPHNSSYFRLAGEQERQGRLDRALRLLSAAFRDPTREAMRPVIGEGMARILQKCASRARGSAFSGEVVYEHSSNPRALRDADKAVPIVSLTTISPRIQRVPQTIESICAQTVKPHSINLYISEEPYLLDGGIDKGDEHVRRIIDMGVNVYMVPNIGPYRKQYPIVQQMKAAGASPATTIITVDDDVLYPPDLIQRLLEAAELGDSVVAHRGRQITFSKELLAPYKSFGAPVLSKSLLNLATGKNGIAYRLRHFPDDPTEYVGPYLAPTADDIWCKWITGVRCVPTTILEPRAAYDPNLDFPESATGDKQGLFHAFNARGTNDDAMLNMEDFLMFRHGVNLCSLHGGA